MGRPDDASEVTVRRLAAAAREKQARLNAAAEKELKAARTIAREERRPRRTNKEVE